MHILGYILQCTSRPKHQHMTVSPHALALYTPIYHSVLFNLIVSQMFKVYFIDLQSRHMVTTNGAVTCNYNVNCVHVHVYET